MLVEQAFAAELAVKRKRAGGIQADVALDIVPRRAQGGNVQAVVLVVVNIAGAAGQQHHLFGLAHGDATQLQRIHSHRHRQADAFGQGGCGLIRLGRAGLADDVNFTYGQTADVQLALPQGGRVPIEHQRIEADLAAAGVDVGFFQRKTTPQRALRVVCLNLHAKQRGQAQ